MKYLLFILLNVLFWQIGFAQNVSIDTSFNSNDACIYGEGADYYVNVSAKQQDGKIIIGGGFSTYNGVNVNHIVRLNTDGSIDNSFNIGNSFEGGTNTNVKSIVIQNDGKILVGGFFSSFNGTTTNNIARLNPDGTLDNTFNVGTGFDTEVNSIALQSDGKIIVGGYFNTFCGVSSVYLIRLNQNGTKDNSFNIGTGTNNVVNTISVQSDDKIILGGYFSSYNGFSSNYMVRLNQDGIIDPTFSIGTGFSTAVFALKIQQDGKIIVGGNFNSFNGNVTNKLARLNADGTFDFSLNIGIGFDNAVKTCDIQSDGKIIVAGFFTNFNGLASMKLVRLNTDGSNDLTFDIGTGYNDNINHVCVQQDGRIIVCGWFNSFNGTSIKMLNRLNSNGSCDTTFNPLTSFDASVYSIVNQADGTILVGGNFIGYNNIISRGIAKLNVDGTLNSSFSTGIGFNNSNYEGIIFSIVNQSDGKILVGGAYEQYNGVYRNSLVRLNPDGTIDLTFNAPGSGLNPVSAVHALAIQADGKILVGGEINGFNNLTYYGILRLNPDGTLDNTFNSIFSSNTIVYSISIQNDGKIIVGGSFSSFGVYPNYLLRLNEDGSLDNTFTIGMGFNQDVLATLIQPDGKILVGGSFTIFNSNPAKGIIRLNVDGSIDNSFITGSGLNTYGNINSLNLQDDGKIVIGGNLISYSGISVGNIARVNSDGLLDMSFNTGNGFNNSVFTTAIQVDGKILVGGFFTSYNGTCRHRIARINGFPDPSIGSAFVSPSDPDSCNGVVYFYATGASNFTFNIGNGIDYVSNTGYLTIDSLCPGIYPFTIADGNGDSLQSVFVIPIDSNYMEANFDSTIIINDTLTMSIENCLIDYNTIDTVYLYDYQILGGDSLSLTFAIVDNIGLNYVTDTLVIPNGNFELQLQLYCFNKTLGHSFVYTIGLQRNSSGLSTLNLEELIESTFVIYPNPASEKVKIAMSTPKANLTIFDVNGKKVMNQEVFDGTEIQVSKLEPGIYLFEFITEGNRIIKRVVKQ